MKQFFVQSYPPSKSQSEKFNVRTNSNIGMKIMHIGNLEFLVDPKENSIIPDNKVCLGSFFYKLLKPEIHSVSLDDFRGKIFPADVIELSGKVFGNIRQILYGIKYIRIGFEYEGFKVDNIVSIKSSKKKLNENHDVFYEMNKNTRIYKTKENITLIGLEEQEKELENFLFSSLLHKDILKKHGYSKKNLSIIHGDKGMKKKKFVQKVCQNLKINFIEYDFLEKADIVKHFEIFLNEIDDSVAPAIIFLDNFITKNLEYIPLVLNAASKYFEAENSHGICLLFNSDTAHQLEHIQKRFSIDEIFTLSALQLNQRIRFISSLLEKIPNELTKEQILEISESFSNDSMQDIERNIFRILQNKIYRVLSIDIKKIEDLKEKGKPIINQKDEIIIENQNNNISEDNSIFDTKQKPGFMDSKLSRDKKSFNDNMQLIDEMQSLKFESQTTENIKLDYFDFSAIIKREILRPNEELLVKSNINFSDIGGYEDVKNIMIEAVIWPITHRDIFLSLGIPFIKGVLLYGPPGCCKTLLAKAISNESKMSFISVKGSELENKWVGETSKAVRNLFMKAKQCSPCIVFIDEIDSISRKIDGLTNDHHSKTLASFLTEMDGIEDRSGVVVIGATNRIEEIDPAFIRPGRIDRIIRVGLPDLDARNKIYEIKLKNVYNDVEGLLQLAKKSEGLSGAEITAVCQEALMNVLRNKILDNKTQGVDLEELENALNKIQEAKRLGTQKY